MAEHTTLKALYNLYYVERSIKFKPINQSFLPCNNASAVLGVVMCLSSVHPSVHHMLVLYQNGYRSHKQCRTITQGLYFSDATNLGET